MFLQIIVILLCSSQNIEAQHHIISVELGTSVSLQCHYKKNVAILYWYKQTIGMNPKVLATFFQHSSTSQLRGDFEGKSRFSVTGNNLIMNLNISQATSSDSALYYCAHRYAGRAEFTEATLLIVTGDENTKHTITQKPILYHAYQGDSINFQCTVFARVSNVNHSVYWFRHGRGKSHPGIIYTHRGRSNQCSKSPETDSSALTCVYNLTKMNLSTLDAGTYYCAVAMCGEILYGNGTSLIVTGKYETLLLCCLASTSAICVILMVTGLLFIIKHKKIICCQRCGGSPQKDNTFSTSTANVQDDAHKDPREVNYVALNIVNKKTKGRRQKTCNKQDTVYSKVLYEKSH